MTVKVPNITNAIEVSKFYLGSEMKSIGAHPSVGAVINEG
jgi:hypothetical protein